MYESLAGFLRNFSAAQPVLWALLVMLVVAAASVTLYAFWELVWRLLPGNSPKKSGRGDPN